MPHQGSRDSGIRAGVREKNTGNLEAPVFSYPFSNNLTAQLDVFSALLIPAFHQKNGSLAGTVSYPKKPLTSIKGVPASAEPLTKSARLAITSSMRRGVVPSVST